jgi:hypothetical protein
MHRDKFQINKHKMDKLKNQIYDLEERTLIFARDCRNFTKKLPKNTANLEDGKQLIRSSGSVGANYIEANEALSKKDLYIELKSPEKRQEKADIGYYYSFSI